MKAHKVLLLVILSGFLTPSAVLAADASTYVAVSPFIAKVDSAESTEARLYASDGATSYIVIVPGEPFIYRVSRSEKKVFALKRSTVMVKPDQCRPMEGGKQEPLMDPVLVDSPAGISFKTNAGKNISVTLPGALRK